jgi:hypothetical protein
LKHFVQLIQSVLACGILVALIFSIPVVMAATPIHLGFAFKGPGHMSGDRSRVLVP